MSTEKDLREDLDRSTRALERALKQIEQLKAGQGDIAELDALIVLLESQLKMWRASGIGSDRKAGAIEALTDGLGYKPYYDLIDWVIVGGESGANARPFDLAWARSIVRQCQDVDVPVFVKQLGANFTAADGAEKMLVRIRNTTKKGNDMDAWPADLRVREFPKEIR